MKAKRTWTKLPFDANAVPYNVFLEQEQITDSDLNDAGSLARSTQERKSNWARQSLPMVMP
jgi:hypothetical protein